jgi:hypothetical protein
MQQRRTKLNDGYDAVHWAANYDDAAALSRCILGDASCVTRVTSRGMTPLHICALNNSVQCARALLPMLPAAAINAANCWAETALHLACACDASDLRALLLDAGANASARDAWGRTPSETAAACHAGQVPTAQPPCPPTPPPPPLQTPVLTNDTAAFNHELLSAISTRKLRSIPPPTVRGIFCDAISPPSIAAAPCGAAAAASSARNRRALSSFVEYPGDHDRVCALLQDATIDAAGADSFGLTGMCI